MKIIMKASVLFSTAILVVGCSGLTGGGNDASPIKSKIILHLGETYAQSGEVGEPQPTLLLETPEDYECCNYEIVSRIQRAGSTLSVDVSGVELPGNLCFTAFGPAQAQFLIPRLADYTRMVVRYRGQADWYTLAIDDTTFLVSGREGSFTHVSDTLVWRFPRRSFVYTCGTLTEDSCLCAGFRDSLMAHLTLRPITVPAEGYWPYPTQTMGHYYDMQPQVFRYSDESEFETAGEILAAFTRTTLSGHQGVGLALRNWRNQRHASWLIPVSSDQGL